MNDILDNNPDFQFVLENAPEMSESDGPENGKKTNYSSILLKIGITLAGLYVFSKIIQNSADRINQNIRKGGNNLIEP